MFHTVDKVAFFSISFPPYGCLFFLVNKNFLFHPSEGYFHFHQPIVIWNIKSILLKRCMVFRSGCQVSSQGESERSRPCNCFSFFPYSGWVEPQLNCPSPRMWVRIPALIHKMAGCGGSVLYGIARGCLPPSGSKGRIFIICLPLRK